MCVHTYNIVSPHHGKQGVKINHVTLLQSGYPCPIFGLPLTRLEATNMDAYQIAAYVISMIHDGHSRSVALDSAITEYDLDDSTYRAVLDELVDMEREYRAGLEL